MKHITTISRRPVKASGVLGLFLDFLVGMSELITVYIFQKNGGSL